jgi:hypothetical protein
METKKISGLQLELSKVYSFELSSNDLEQIEQMCSARKSGKSLQKPNS